ncbi:MAG: TetR/AcrR family transcriptional regulator [Magnetococcales bacterium]|nr:TetR/AcrR family transcriptional regulator [Magnetococcales bacterium]
MGRTSDARERLIQSGMDLLQAGGYAQAGVQEICARAGVRKGSFYHFFATKSHLGLAVVEQFHAASIALLDQALAKDLPVPERIERLFLMVATIQETFRDEAGAVKGCPFGNLVLEMSTRDESLRLVLARVLRDTIARLESTLRSGSPAAEPARIREQAEAIFSLLEGAILVAKAENDPAIIRRMALCARQMVAASA